MIDAASFQTQRASDAYTDVNSVQALRGLKDKNQALGEISKQFESMLVRMMLKSMRDANQVFAKDNPLNSNETEFYQNMMDDQLALSLSTGRGIGLAEVMQRQLSQKTGLPNDTSVSDSESGSPVPERNLNLKPLPGFKKGQVIDFSSRQIKTENIANKTIELGGSPEHFSKQLFDLAEKAGKELGVSPETLLAQAALETSWGNKVVSNAGGRSSYNLFNIKADGRWQGPSVAVSTLEYRDGLAVKETANFRAYNSYEESFSDYVAFIKNSTRYQPALQASTDQNYVQELSANGYATDPHYAEKIIRIMDSPAIRQANQPTELAQALEF